MTDPINESGDTYAVVGNPIGHSLSPVIHTLFAAQTGEAMTYEARLGDRDDFEEQVREWFEDGLGGLNVTVPFKEEAYQIVHVLTERAERAGAVNTIWLEDDFLVGDNTDGVGLLQDIQDRLHFDPAGRDVLILGAGGAVRGILAPLVAAMQASDGSHSAPRLVIANRTVERAERLVEEFADLQAEVHLEACPLEAIPAGPYGLILNATSAGLGDTGLDLPPGLFAPDALAYDLVYGPAARIFLDWAEAQGGVQTSDGLGMLVEQAAEAFFQWRGVRPDTEPVLDALRALIVAQTG
jgi:shikimate dehydrogenase